MSRSRLLIDGEYVHRAEHRIVGEPPAWNHHAFPYCELLALEPLAPLRIRVEAVSCSPPVRESRVRARPASVPRVLAEVFGDDHGTTRDAAHFAEQLILVPQVMQDEHAKHYVERIVLEGNRVAVEDDGANLGVFTGVGNVHRHHRMAQ